jgi:cytochrome c553
MTRTLTATVLLALAAAATPPCTGADEDVRGVEFFERHVRPLLEAQCAECHARGKTEGGLSIDSRAALLRGGDSGPALTPGQPDKSRLLEAVRYKNPSLQMPPSGPLSAGDVRILEQWISMGAPDPRPDAPPMDPRPTGMGIEDGRQFWSMRPVNRPPVPQGSQDAPKQSPIDAFLLKELVSNGLTFAPPADRRTLLRRVTYDLTGLPPTAEELRAFELDDRPDAYDRVVDRLLASPQYGVRWGRHWLDVARYADSNGLDENLAFGNAWRYRDYVIRAFNEDRPFDRFLVEQIAGDLLPDASDETRIATGFLALGGKVLAEPDREKLVMDTIDEQIDTVGKVFLGLTLGCARCHDHKFDPIKQADYYRLAAIFKSTKTFGDTNTGAIKHWYEHPLGTDAEREALKAVDAAIAEKQKAASSFKSAAMNKVREEARSKGAIYLAAAAEIAPGMSLREVATVAERHELHPRVLHHCRLHLAYHDEDPLFEQWRVLAAKGDVTAIEQHYTLLFAKAESAWVEAKKADPKTVALSDPALEAARAALHDAAGFLAIPSQAELALDSRTLEEYHALAEAARQLESSSPDAPAAMSVADGVVVPTLPIHIRGSHHNLGEPVERGVPVVLLSPGQSLTMPADHSGRLELARWMTHPENPLPIRVYVNRVWGWHFGQPLVPSTENFGVLGQRPSHPELLDWLASEFVESGFSTKAFHRLVLNSAAYQMSSRADSSQAASIDPENRLLWKFPLRRLEAEELRDSILAVSRRLDDRLDGKTVPLRNRQFVFDHTSIDHTRYDSLRRAAYLPVIRNNVYSLFEQFDFPDPTMPTGNRSETTVAPQALALLNSPLVLDSADAVACALLSTPGDEARVLRAYDHILGRTPEASEMSAALAFIDRCSREGRTRSEAVESSSIERAWSLFCQTLLISNEFLHVR